MAVKVLKFGGSILKRAQDIIRAADYIQQNSGSGPIAVVVSALYGVTDKLTVLANSDKTYAEKVLQSLFKLHLSVCQELTEHYPHIALGPVNYQLTLLKSLTEQVEQTNSTVHFLTFGEKLSAQLLLATLKAKNLHAQHLAAEEYMHMYAKDNHSATPNLAKTRASLSNLEFTNTDITVTEGFYGINEQAELACFARNGSDLSAAILACALDADYIEILTDVDGIYDRDPKKHNDAKLLKKMSYENAMQLANSGAEVVFAPTLYYLKEAGIELRVGRDGFSTITNRN